MSDTFEIITYRKRWTDHVEKWRQYVRKDKVDSTVNRRDKV
jgi:hypothetical protein